MSGQLFGILTSFDHNSQDWKTYKSRLTQWFVANDITDTTDATETKRRAILLSALTESTYRLAADLALPKDLQVVPYKDIIQLLNNHFNPEAKLILTVDASPGGLGAVLSQVGDDGVEAPLSFASRTLTAAETRYSQIQKEATAIIFGVRRFHQYLYGRSKPFVLRTDHKPLISIFGPHKGIPEVTANRLQRYAIFLNAYNYVIEYVRSNDNSADFLSRACLPAGRGAGPPPGRDDEVKVCDRAAYVYFVIDGSLPVTITDIQEKTRTDVVLSSVVNYVMNGWPNKISDLRLKPYHLCRTQLAYENGCVMRGHKVVIPEALREKLLSEVHSSHLGIVKTKAEVRARFWFPGVDEAVERLIGGCAVCIQLRPAPARAPPGPGRARRAPPGPGRARRAPRSRVHIDLLGPIADCLHLQLYRDPKDRFKKGQTKASLSLQQFLGFESGFTLDKESNTIAIICRDVVVVLAFETRERLIAWQVKVGSQLGSSKEWLVMVGAGTRKLPAGPARLHLQGRRFALTSGVPPRLLGLWELAHLRRYGVVEGRFCFEGGSLCGKGEGLHVLITDQAQDVAAGFDAAAHPSPKPPASRRSEGADRTRPDTRLSDLTGGDQSIPDTGLYEQNFFGDDCGHVSPFWPSDERRGYDEHDCKGCEEAARPPWSGADHVTLERCSNCVTKLGTMTRSSTVALTPGTHFNPAWTMEAVPESSSDNSSNSTEYLTPRAIKKTLQASQRNDWAPQRPPKPSRLDEKKPPAVLPANSCSCINDTNFPCNVNNPKVGPYENYDVPKSTHIEVEAANDYYDTPKRIKRALADDLFQVTKSSAPGNLVLKKNCGCILKFGSKKKPVVVECEENIQPVDCPCQKVTNWANNLISLPYCKRTMNYDKVNTEVLTSQKSEDMALYATVDVTRKTNRQSSIAEKDNIHDCNEAPLINYENLEPKGENELEDPYANYENLEFALSLEYYENAKDLLKKAGVTQKELDALSANVDFAEGVLPAKSKCCAKCGHHSSKPQSVKKNKSDEYLLMEPSKDIKRDLCQTVGPNPGYTPMLPNPNWSQSLRHPLQKLQKVEKEKSLSIPTLNSSASQTQNFAISLSTNNNKEAVQKRSCSIDSARLLEDLKEFDSSIGSHGTSSSLETLRNLAIENRRSSSSCDNGRDCCDHECCKSSDSENKTSEGSSKDVPHLRNKHMDNAQIKRSSSVPCKSGGNRDSSSSNDSGVSSCSMKHGPEFNEFEMPLTSGHSRYQYMANRRMRGNVTGCIHSSLPRKSKSSDLRDASMQIHKTNFPAKSSSAEAEVPVLPPKQFKGVMDTHSTSSGTSDMSDYIETLSLTSSHSSSDNPNIRMTRQPTMTLRPRSGKEYQNLDPIITSMYKTGKELTNYTNLP